MKAETGRNASFASARSCFSAAILFLALASSFGWGETAERLITNKAVDTLPEEMQPFFQANRQFLVQHVAAAEESEPKTGTRHATPISFSSITTAQFPFAALPRDYTAAVAKFGRRTLEAVRNASLANRPLQQETHRRISRAQLETRSGCPPPNWPTTSPRRTIPSTPRSTCDGKLSDSARRQRALRRRPGRSLSAIFLRASPTKRLLIRDPTDHAFEMSASTRIPGSKMFYSPIVALMRGFPATPNEYYDRFYAQAGAVLIRQLSDASTDIGSTG